VFFGAKERRFVEKIGSYRNPQCKLSPRYSLWEPLAYLVTRFDSLCGYVRLPKLQSEPENDTLSGRVPFNPFSLLPLRSESGKDGAPLGLVSEADLQSSHLCSPILLREAPPVITVRHRLCTSTLPGRLSTFNSFTATPTRLPPAIFLTGPICYGWVEMLRSALFARAL
jgi:hypothetical protein